VNWLKHPSRTFSDEFSDAYWEAWGKAAGGWRLQRPSPPPEPLPLDHPLRRWRAGAPATRPVPRWLIIVWGGGMIAVVAAIFVLAAVYGPL